MKFIDQHRKEIFAAMEKVGFREDDFSYVKRKGRIHICYPPGDTHFAYLRKKETLLDPVTKQWKHHEFFKVHIKNQKETDMSWEELMGHFRGWISSLPDKY